MSQSYALQLCHLVAPERLSDRLLTSGVLLQKEGTFVGDQVLLAYVLEVTKPWFPSSRVLPTIVDTITHYHGLLTIGKNLEDQFEQLLRSVNEQLNIISEQGETDWIGNFNGLILIVAGNQLHFSQTGHSPAYLLQNNRIRQITDDAAGEREPHPLKTFSNLASGSITEQDQVLISNKELYREISLDALRRIMNSSSPYQSAIAVAKELKKERNPAVSSIFLKVGSRAEAESNQEPQTVILEEEMQSRARKLRKKLAPVVGILKNYGKQAGEMSVAAGRKAGQFTKTTVAPLAEDLAGKIKNQIKNKAPHKGSQPVVEVILSKSAQNKQRLQAIAQQAEEAADQRYIPANELPEESTVSEAEFNWKEYLLHWFSSTKNRKTAAIVGAVLLLLLLTITLLHRRQADSGTSTASTNSSLLKDISDLNQKISSAVALQQEVEATREIETANQKIGQLKDLTSDQRKQENSLWTSLNSQTDTLTKTTRLASAATYNFTATSTGFVANLPYFYGYNPTEASLFRTGSGDPTQTQQTINLTDAHDSIISLTSSSESDTAAYALTKQNKVFRVVQSANTTTLQSISPASGSFASADYIGSYLGNVYLLDGKTGLLWKYANSGTVYNKGVSIIDINKYDIKNSVSLAIDGSIYILKQDGTLLRFTHGAQDDFGLKDQPTLLKKLLQPIQVITNDNMDDIYVLDAGLTSGDHSTARVLEFHKSGSYVRSYGLPDNFTQVSWFDISPKEKKLWVLNGKQISEFSLP